MKKIDVLNLLSAEPNLDAATISGSLDGTPEATGMLLVRLVRQGLLCREIEDRRFIYTLTAKGEARRRHLNTHERELTG